MAASLANNRSVARQVTLAAIGLVALVLVLVGLAIAVLTERSTRAQVVASVGDTAQSVAQSLDAADNTNRELVQLTMKGFQRYFEATMQLDEATGELRSYGALVNEDYGSVDKFASETGGIATVFAKKGDDFIRITTSVKNDKGERQQGTPLGKDDPAYATVAKGEPYTGVTVVGGKPFMGHYLPAKDASGKVIALLFIGNDISVFHAMLQKQVTQTKFFEHGGTYVINPGTSLDKAVFVYHPTARGKRVLEAYPQARPFFEALAASQDGFVREAAPVLGAGATDPWALVRKTGGGWWVVAEVADGEAMASQRRVTLAVWGLMAVAVVLLAIGLFLMLRRGVSRPLQDLTQAITLVAQGDLTEAFRTTRRDEIGALVQEVEGMRQRYTQMLQQVRTAVDSITTASAEIASGNQDLSARTEATASSLAQTAQSMEHLTSTVRQSADAARQANQLASTAAAVAALEELDIPYIAAHPLEFQTLGQWGASGGGLGPVETTMLIALPEIDGATNPTVFAGRHDVNGCTGCAKNCQPQSAEALQKATTRQQVWLQKNGQSFGVNLLDMDGRVGMDFGVYGLPETYLIDREGVVRFKHAGALTPDVVQQKLLPLLRGVN